MTIQMIVLQVLFVEHLAVYIHKLILSLFTKYLESMFAPLDHMFPVTHENVVSQK